LLGNCSVPHDLDNVIQVSSICAQVLALKLDGRVIGWGYNDYGKTNISKGLNDVVQIGCGNIYSAALINDNTVVVWGCGKTEKYNEENEDYEDEDEENEDEDDYVDLRVIPKEIDDII
jgi:alpha-tubulin suppressor-like RCC1 family protein